MPQAYVIYNPIAGRGLGEGLAKRAAERLRERGFEVECLSTCARGGATPIAQEVAGRADRLVVVGGDGTLCETIHGLGEARSRVPVGMVPTGNANIVARDLCIPTDHEAAIEVAVEGVPVDLDVGFVRCEAFHGLFLGVVGIGWDALTVERLDHMRHTCWGGRWYRFWADSLYVLAALLPTLRLGAERFHMSLDGVRQTPAYCAAYLCNLRSYGKGMAMTPDARCDSGVLYAHGRKRSGPVWVLWHLVAARLGRRSPGFLSDYAEARKVELHGEVPFAVQVDGDPRGHTASLELGVEPAAVRILVPPAPMEVHSTRRIGG